jgi:hypothetical protein
MPRPSPFGVVWCHLGRVIMSHAMQSPVPIEVFAHPRAGATDWSQEAREANGASPGTSKWQAAGV